MIRARLLIRDATKQTQAILTLITVHNSYIQTRTSTIKITTIQTRTTTKTHTISAWMDNFVYTGVQTKNYDNYQQER